MVTIKDVAKLAGVSYTTVSHVVNGTRFVAPETEAKVRAAIDRLGYKPSSIARSLRSGVSKTIGIISCSTMDHYFHEVVHGAEEAASDSGYGVFLSYTEPEPSAERFFIDDLVRRGVDGIILDSVVPDEELASILESLKLPIVLFQRRLPGVKVDTVATDDESGTRAALGHLIELGHERIGFVYAFAYQSHAGFERHRVYREIMEGSRAGFRPEYLRDGDFCMQKSYDETKALLSLADRPTALFYYSDMMAFGGMAACLDSGIDVPGGISLLGYDDIAMSAWMRPRLSTVRQPKRELGKACAERLIARIANPDLPPEHIVLPVELVRRDSTAAPRP
jgi:LacI family transcriptional regulator